MAQGETFHRHIARRSLLKMGAAGAVAAQLGLLEHLARQPERVAAANAGPFPLIQFDIGSFVAPARTFNDGAGAVVAQFGPVFTLFVPIALTRTPTQQDRLTLNNALGTIEQLYDFSPSGIFVFAAYGVPYFNRLPGGLHGPLVSRFMPRLLSDPSRFALEEAVPSPTDVVQGFVGGPNAPVPNVRKDRFNVNVRIESNDVLLTMRSDSLSNIGDVLAWLQGSNSLKGFNEPSPPWNGLVQFQQTRLQFVQPGLPRKVADANGIEFAPRISPDSPMFFGFADQQQDSSGPAAICTFAGNSSARFTNATQGDYLGLGGIQHFSHVILDGFQFFSLPGQDARHPDGEPFTERVQYMFRSNQLRTTHGLPAEGNADQFTQGGGPAFVNNVFQGTNDASLSAGDADGLFAPPPAGRQTQRATFTGLPRIGHESALQRSSRASDGTPVHIRMDGPGFDGMDVPAFQTFPGGATIPAGSNQPKLQFTVFVPTAEFFRAMRVNVAAQDLQVADRVDPDDNGLERFITATRRQNFLVPPRPVRAFPLVEFT